MSSSKNEEGENKDGATMAKSRVKAIKVLSSVIRQGSDEAMVQQDGVAMVAPSSPIVRRKVNGGNFDGDKRGDGSFLVSIRPGCRRPRRRWKKASF